MSENLPERIDGPGREGQMVIYIPKMGYIKDKLAEDGPVRWHALTLITNIGIGILVMFFTIFPAVFWGLLGLGFLGSCYALVHAAVFYMFFHKSHESDF